LNQFYILEEHAKNPKLAGATFLIFEGRQWTYKQTYEAVLAIGTWLKATYDIKPKDIIAMNFGNSDKFILMWFALWSIGARPALINYNLVGKALIHCIRVSTASLALIDPQFESNITEEVLQELPGINFVTYSPEREAVALAFAPVRQPDSDRSSPKVEDMSMLIYTSGTTGLPKPALVSWGKIVGGSTLNIFWMGYKRSDIFYTVSTDTQLLILPICSNN